MLSQQNTPEFGQNGAVLNSGTMTRDLRQDYENRALKDRLKVTPRVWPHSAILLIVAGAFLFGMHYAMRHADGNTAEAFWLGIIGMGLVFSGFAWRYCWNRFFNPQKS